MVLVKFVLSRRHYAARLAGRSALQGNSAPKGGGGLARIRKRAACVPSRSSHASEAVQAVGGQGMSFSPKALVHCLGLSIKLLRFREPALVEIQPREMVADLRSTAP